MAQARVGKAWQPAEENTLLDELSGDSTLPEIAERHERTTGAIAARLTKLLTPERVFDSHDDLFAWARSELHKGQVGPLDRAGATATDEPTQQATATDGTPPPATTQRRADVIAIWSSITGGGDSATHRPHGKELDALGTYDDARLHAAGTAVLQATGELRLAQWLLEADWPGIERLTITADQIRAGTEEARKAGADLLMAGMARTKERDREIMQQRLGLAGNPLTLNELGERHGLSAERIRQIQLSVIKYARGGRTAAVRRCWHHAHDTLVAALSGGPEDNQLDPDLVLSFVKLVTPFAPRELAVSLVASLCGLLTQDSRDLAAAVEERHQRTYRPPSTN